MPDIYEELYYFLFNRITDAELLLESGAAEQAYELLLAVQGVAEDLFIASGEGKGPPF